MSEFKIRVWGAQGCVPCQHLKEDLDKLSVLLDMDYTYVDITKDAISDLPENVQSLARKYGDGETVSVPLYVVETECASFSGAGYSGRDLRDILEQMVDIRCKNDAMPEVRKETGQ